MVDFDDTLARWQASLSPQVPRTAVAQFLSEDGAALREAFDHASRTVRERRAARAFHGWLDRQALAGRDFDDAQLHWLDLMRQDITAIGELSLDRLNHGPFLARGGEDKAVRLFGRRTLGEVVASLNATLASMATACGGTCGVKVGGCGCSGSGKPKSVETAGSTTLEPGEYEALELTVGREVEA
ncbi:type I restriction-modification enzyme R subunit C-terminal domain-containing protein [Nannocystis bainbridge]|uniref:Type I restriction-modification enzyme R subunit C-terminal domain-containing protein n=1 Tax=Nannocystis bainbridge TaxID=2995303 RepID=A0ABT5DRC0_9BACT|nr:type I restriction-modification enzyme R subunit C-terminal domain-containing protein [Nannocystis bainbridge]MDC0716197.1 type I restriction-modification enzyme R subunit C-terminal domain-containing protein [Nannocystis bainbridge]